MTEANVESELSDTKSAKRFPSRRVRSMNLLKKTSIIVILIIGVIAIDFRVADLAHNNLLKNSADFQQRLSKVDLDLTGPKRQGCKITRTYILNAYQTCFVARYGEPGDGIQGFTFVYHRPMPLSLLYGQTSESRYFRFSEYGTALKEIRKYGYVNHLFQGGSQP